MQEQPIVILSANENFGTHFVDRYSLPGVPTSVVTTPASVKTLYNLWTCRDFILEKVYSTGDHDIGDTDYYSLRITEENQDEYFSPKERLAKIFLAYELGAWDATGSYKGVDINIRGYGDGASVSYPKEKTIDLMPLMQAVAAGDLIGAAEHPTATLIPPVESVYFSRIERYDFTGVLPDVTKIAPGIAILFLIGTCQLFGEASLFSHNHTKSLHARSVSGPQDDVILDIYHLQDVFGDVRVLAETFREHNIAEWTVLGEYGGCDAEFSGRTDSSDIMVKYPKTQDADLLRSRISSTGAMWALKEMYIQKGMKFVMRE